MKQINFVVSMIREQRERDEFDQHVRDEMQRQKCEVTKDQIRVDQKTEYRKRLIMERLKEMETKEAVDNLKVSTKIVYYIIWR